MAASGAVYKDLLPGPSEAMEAEPRVKRETTATMTDKPSDSHALAMEAAKNPELMGASQVDHAQEVKDLGWNEPEQKVAAPLVGGLSNEDLWVLVRRFNKVRISSCRGFISLDWELELTWCLANVSYQGDPTPASWWFGPQYCGR